MRLSRLLPLPLLGLILVGLAGCGTQPQGSRIDERTYRIESPRIPGGATAPNQRLADQYCPNGYRVLNQSRDSDYLEGGISIIWTIRCL
jgi:hypothetical protein